jgi:hypothetical protein
MFHNGTPYELYKMIVSKNRAVNFRSYDSQAPSIAPYAAEAIQTSQQ